MNSRAFVIQIIVIFVAVVFAARLFYLQIIDENYKSAAENNVLQKTISYPYRGMMYDRNNQLIVYNTPVYDLMVIPNEAKIKDTLAFCEMLEISKEILVKRLKKAKKHSRILGSVILEQISEQHFAKVQDKLVNYPGFYIQPRTIRSYSSQSMANALGYIGEVSSSFLDRDTTNYYKSGDYIGIKGIEKQYENYLRGKRGVSYHLVNVRGEIKDKYRNGKFDTLSIPGDDIQLTIDISLQHYAEKLMDGKVGSLVAIEPQSGNILAIVSSPSFAPSLLSGGGMSKNFGTLIKDPNKPLYNRPIQARYPPGSMFKTLQSVIALHEKVITPKEIIYTDGTNIGDLAPPGRYNLQKAIRFSSNNFFYLLMKRMVQQKVNPSPFIDSRIGYEQWRKYVMEFGLGKKLGVDLPNEVNGKVPSIAFYDKVYGTKRWKYSNVSSLSIGQGELLVTPIQMANLGAIIANKGYYYTPHLVRNIAGRKNNSVQKYVLPFDTAHFNLAIDGMEQVVNQGSGRRGYMKSLKLCGKTSTVQNPHGEDHSGFMGFAPKNAPKIAVAAYVENAGQGGRAAVSVASLVAEKYIFGKTSREWLETYVLEKHYLTHHAKQ